jgi:hypothetical protein
MPLHEKHKEKIRHLAHRIEEELYNTSLKLAHSGAIDMEAYNPNTYILSKILITAAQYKLLDTFILSDEHKQTVEDLLQS